MTNNEPTSAVNGRKSWWLSWARSWIQEDSDYVGNIRVHEGSAWEHTEESHLLPPAHGYCTVWGQSYCFLNFSELQNANITILLKGNGVHLNIQYCWIFCWFSSINLWKCYQRHYRKTMALEIKKRIIQMTSQLCSLWAEVHEIRRGKFRFVIRANESELGIPSTWKFCSTLKVVCQMVQFIFNCEQHNRSKGHL